MRAITKETKVNVYKAIYCPILTRGCESWVLSKDIRNRIQAAEKKNKRNFEKRHRGKRSGETRAEVEPKLKKIPKQQLKWFGHLKRMNDSRAVRKVWQASTTGKRKRGRPRKTWEKSIADILKEKNVTWNGASKKVRNKKEWAKFVHE